jgi:hypothetical protein
MKTKIDYYNKTLELLKTLKKEYPFYEMAKHLSNATSDYQDIWGLSDRELYDLLEKYKFDLDTNTKLIASDSDIDKIVRDGMNLDTILDPEDDY